jgi:hypothetical protein
VAVVQLHAQVILPTHTGVPRDDVINTFTFSGDHDPDVYAAGIAGSLEDFYNDLRTTNAVASYLHRYIDRTADLSLIKVYNVTGHLGGSAVGPPILIHPWTIGGTIGTDGLPAECAAALSFHGTYGTAAEFAPGARPRARHRGRVYIGPLISTIVDEDDNNAPRAAGFFRQDLCDAGEALIGADQGWVVWSRTNAAVYPVVGGWVDDAFDTIRGRGPDPTTRTTFLSVV